MTDGNEALQSNEDLSFKESLTQVENTASTMYTLYLPRFRTQVDKLSNKALRRVLKALIEYPLVEEEYNFSTQLEKDTFFIAEQLILSKLMMIQETMLNHPELLQEQPQTDNVETEIEVNNNG